MVKIRNKSKILLDVFVKMFARVLLRINIIKINIKCLMKPNPPNYRFIL